MPWDTNSDWDQMIAPYQRAASQFQSPYSIVDKNSWLAQNHPGVANVADNAFLAAAMTPGPSGPEGVGGGISRTFQGLLGARQYQRQQQLTAAMLPYQMMQPMLNAAHTRAQIGQEEAAADYYRAHGKYLGDMTDINQQKADIAQQRADQAKFGKQLNDPEERFAYNSVFKKYGVDSIDKLTPDQLGEAQTNYENLKRQSHIRSGSASLNEYIIGANPRQDGETDPAYNKRIADAIISGQSQIAGGRTSAEQNAPHPQVTADKLMDDSAKWVNYGLEKPKQQKSLDYMMDHPEVKSPEEAVMAMQKNQADYDQKVASRGMWRTSYLSSDAPKNGIGFIDYLKQQKAMGVNIGSFGNLPDSPTSSGVSAQGGTGSSWTPKQ